MKIATVLQLDVGQTGIAIEGRISWAGQAPKNITGTGYNFWTQFVVIEDETGKIGVSVNVAEGQTLAVGEHIRIEKARLEKYRDKTSLGRAKIAPPLAATPNPAMNSQSRQNQSNASQAYANPVQGQINRGCAIRGLSAFFQNSKDNISVSNLLDVAEIVSYWIETGKRLKDEPEGSDIDPTYEQARADQSDDIPF